MNSDLYFENKKYISAKEASKITGYSKDYIGQLSRDQKIVSKKVGRTWYVEEESLLNYKNTPSDFEFSKNLSKVQTPVFNTLPTTPALSSREAVTPAPVVPPTAPVIPAQPRVETLVKETELPHYKKKVYKAFVRNINLPFQLAAVACALIMAIGLYSLPADFMSFGSAAEKDVVAVSRGTQSALAFVSHLDMTGTAQKLSIGISSSPARAYTIMSDVLSFYSAHLAHGYVAFGTTLTNTSGSMTDAILGQTVSFLRNPPLYVLRSVDQLSLLDVHVVDTTGTVTASSVSRGFYALGSAFDSALADASFVQTSTQHISATVASTIAKNNPKENIATVAVAVQKTPATSFDAAGVSVYRAVNSFFETSVYNPLATLFGVSVTKLAAAPVSTTTIKTNTKAVAATKTPAASQNVTRIIERVVAAAPSQTLPTATAQSLSGYVSEAQLETRLNQFANNISSKFYAQTTGTGGNVTNVYNEIAGSQRIDQLTGTQITTPTIADATINGGTISGMSISSSSVAATTLSASTLAVSATSTFAGATFAGPVGIGITNPQYALDILGDLHVSGGLIAASQTIGGDFGVTGTTTTNNLLATNATSTNLYASNISGNTVAVNNISSGSIIATSSATLGTTTATNLAVTNMSTSTFAGALSVGGNLNFNGVLMQNNIPYIGSQWTTSGNNLFYNTGNIGLGTSSPYAKLSVAGSIVSDYFNATSTTATSTIAGGLSVSKGLNLGSGYITGAGLSTSCDISTGKLLWNAATGQFSCGVDAGSTSGLASIGAQYSPLQIGASQMFATTSDTNIGLTITSLNNVHTFSPVWIGQLSPVRGGTGLSTAPTYGQLLVGNATGGYTLTATSSLGIVSNTLTKGNFLVGSDSGVAQATSSIFISSTGNVGIGTTTPWGQLSVNPNGLASGVPEFVIGSSTASHMVVLQNGNVGIGTKTPSQMLQVGTTMYVDNVNHRLGIGVASPSYDVDITNGINIGAGQYYRVGAAAVIGTEGNASTLVRATGGNAIGFGANGHNSLATADMVILSNGNVGIGTTSPGQLLDVQGASSPVIKVTSTSAGHNDMATMGVYDGTSGAIFQAYGQSFGTASLAGKAGFGPDGATGLVVFDNASSHSGSTGTISLRSGGYDTAAEKLLLDQNGSYFTNGNVGIGTTNPANALTVMGTSSASTAFVVGTGSAGITTSGSNDIKLIDGLGNTSFRGLRFSSGIWADSVASTFFQIGNNSDNVAITAQSGTHINRLQLSAVTTQVGGLYYDTIPAPIAGDVFEVIGNTSGNNVARMVVQNTGNVGIGTTSPSDKLEIYNGILSIQPSLSGSTDDKVLKIYNYAGNERMSLGYDNSNIGLIVNNRSGSPLAYFSESGNVGIGTTSPSQMLTVGNNNQFTVSSAGALSAVSAAFGSAGQANITSGGLIRAGYGGTTGPGLSFAGSATNYGLYFNSGANALGMVSNGTEAMDIVNGNVGIGTTGPGYPLDVNGTINSNGTIQATNIAGYNLKITNTSGAVLFWGGSSNDAGISRLSAGKLAIGNGTAGDYSGTLIAGNVGIGTTTPGSLLSLGTTNGINFSLATSTFTSTGGINLTSGCFAVNGVCAGTGNGTVTAGTQGQIPFYNTAGSTLTATSSLFIAQNGNVGIGTTSPATKLDVYGGMGRFTDTAGRIVEIGSDNGTFNAHFGTLTSHNFKVITNNAAMAMFSTTGGLSLGTTFQSTVAPTNGMIIEGNVGIGTTNPYRKLEVVGTGADGYTNGPMISLYDNGGYSGLRRFTFQDAWSSTWGGNALLLNVENDTGGLVRTPLTIESNGNIGIGTTSPLQALDVVGSLRLSTGNIYTPNNGGIGFQVSNSGDTAFGSFYADNTSGTPMMVVANSTGNVGIGTTSPATKLQVSSDNIIVGTSIVASTPQQTSNVSFLTTNAQAQDVGAMLGLGGMRDDAASNAGVFGGIRGAKLNSTSGNNSGYLGFYTLNNGVSFGERMRIDNAGNVGIGTTSPSQLLTVGNNNQFTVSSAGVLTTPTISGVSGGNLLVTSDIFGNYVNVAGLGATISGMNIVIPSGKYANVLGTRISVTAQTINVPYANATGGLWLNTSGQFIVVKAYDGVPTNQGLGTPPANSIAILRWNTDAGGTTILALYVDANNAAAAPMFFDYTGMYATSAKLDGYAPNNGGGYGYFTTYYGLSVFSRAQNATILSNDSSGNTVVGKNLIVSGTGNTTIAGNVGIGDASPGSKLSVVGNATIGYASGQTAPANGLIINGNVGIGTTSPSEKLTVQGDNASIKLQTNGNPAQFYTRLKTFWDYGHSMALYAAYGGAETEVLGVYKNNTALMTGNVGIGTTNPQAKLDVQGSASSTSLYLPMTTDSTTGVIYQNGSPFIHTYKPSTGDGYNIFVGLNSGNFTMGSGGSTSYGSYNTAIGVSTLPANTTGYKNFALGFGAMYKNTTGHDNVAMGQSALNQNLGGLGNIAIGSGAMQSSVSGNNNISVGSYTMLFNNSGTDNTAIGNYAGTGISALNDSNRQSVIDNYMVFLGSQATRDVAISSTTPLTNGIAIGYNAQVGCSNCMSLGATSTPINVGIGTTTPNASLNIYGTGVTNLLRLDASQYNFSTIMNGENITIQNGYTGAGWARNLMLFQDANATPYFGFGAGGSGQTFSYGYIGPSNTNTWLKFGQYYDLTNVGNNYFGTVNIGTSSPTTSSLFINTASLNTNYGSGLGINGTYGTPTQQSVINLNAYGVKSGGGYGSALAFSTTNNGVLAEAMRIINNGNLGIGTTSPFAKLDILSSAGGATPLLNIASSTNGLGTTSALFVAANGNVGIGTTSPDQKLTVAGGLISGGTNWSNANSKVTLDLAYNNAKGYASYNFPQGGKFISAEDNVYGSNDIFFQGIPATTGGSTILEGWNGASLTIGTGNPSYNSTAPIIFAPNRVEKVRITSSGNVGIGTTGPTTPLSVNGAGQTLAEFVSTGTGKAMVRFQDSGNTYSYIGATGTGGGFGVWANNASTNLLTIQENGNVGIGTTTPGQALTVNGMGNFGAGPSGEGAYVFGYSNGGFGGLSDSAADASVGKGYLTSDSANYLIQSTTYFGSAVGTFNGVWNANGLSINNGSTGAASGNGLIVASGNVGVGTTTPWKTFSVNGTVSFAGLTTNSSAQSSSLCLSSKNEVVADTNGSGCLVSSIRFKQNVSPLSLTDNLDELMRLQPVSFQYKPDFNGSLNDNPNFSGQQVGFIAEQVQGVDPRLVDVETATTTFEGVEYPAGTPHTVRYEQMTALITSAVQELNLNVEGIASTTASSTPASQSFVASFFNNLFTRLIAWFADAENGITKFFAGEVDTQKLCVSDASGSSTCITKAQLDALINNATASSASSGTDNASSTPVDTTAPVISIEGNNPAVIGVGSSYNDIGATVRDTNADGSVNNNLGLHFSVDGTDMSEVSLDTGTTTNAEATTTHTVVYSAVDGAGNWGYATRTVEVVHAN